MNDKERFYELINGTDRDGKELLLKYLEKSDFFNAPASTQYHSSFDGGLLHHSLKVYDKLLELTMNNGLEWKNKDSIIVIALLHDICKAQFYSVDYRNVKNEQGVWEKKPYYKVEDKVPIGIHGDKSVMMLLKLGFKLTNEEIYCIRYHMGAYESKEVVSSLSNATRICENILWVHLADMLATIEEEREVKK